MTPADHWPPPRVAWYAVGVLFIAYVFSFADRYALSLFIQPIKQDLGLSDTMVSLLHGFAFTIFYTTAGIPMGRLADRHSRRLIIAAGIATWSAMTAACGLARNFTQLFIARIGVGIGESTLSPSAVSIIADLFPPQQLGRAMSVYTAGGIIGGGLVFIVGGLLLKTILATPDVTLPWVGTLRAWQLAFILIGLPGLVVAALAFTFPEPARRVTARGVQGTDVPPMREALAFIRTLLPVYLPHFLGFTMISLVFNAALAWMPTLMLRVHAVPPGESGPAIGLAMLVGGSLGIMAGGWYADRLVARGTVDAALRIGIIAGIGALPFAVAAPLTSSPFWALMMCGPLLFFTMSSFGAALAALQQVTPNRLRGLVSAIYLLTGNLIALGFGPTAVALCTDYVFASEMALGKSLALVAGTGSVLTVVILSLGLAPFRAAVQRSTTA